MDTRDVRFWVPVVAVALLQYVVWRAKRSKPEGMDAMMETMERARILRKTDPAAADRLMNEEALRWQAIQKAQRDALRQRAATDPAARKELRAALSSELATFRKEVAGDNRGWWPFGERVELNAALRLEMKEEIRVLEAEIAALDQMKGGRG